MDYKTGTDYRDWNSKNMQALLDFLSQNPNSQANTIGYIQASWMVLLGKGHDQADVARVEAASGDWKHKGALIVRIGQGRLIVRIAPDRKGSMGELETAIKAAVDGTTRFKGWPITFEWPQD